MENLEKVLKALADKNRLRILKLLEKRRMCVCELTYIMAISQPSVSRHIKKLRSAGLIKGERDGLWTFYYINGVNSFSKVLLKKINDDKIIREDLNRAEKADKKILCVSK